MQSAVDEMNSHLQYLLVNRIKIFENQESTLTTLYAYNMQARQHSFLRISFMKLNIEASY